MPKFLLQRYLLLLSLVSLCPFLAGGQMLDPVKWDFSHEKTGVGQYELQLKADLDDGWHMYSQELPDDATPLPTVVEFKDHERARFPGKAEEKGVVTEPDPLSGNELNFFKGEALIVQKVKVKGTDSIEVKGTVEFMVCDDERCLPPKKKQFSFKLPGKAKESKKDDKEEGQEQGTAGMDSAKKGGMVDPVEWKLRAFKLDNGRYLLRTKALIDKGWHLYATELKEGDGPVATSIEVKKGKGQQLIGQIQKQKPSESYDPNYQRKLRYYKDSTFFEQTLARDPGGADSARVVVEFMACNDERCTVPKTVALSTSFSEVIKGNKKLSTQTSEKETEAEKKAPSSQAEREKEREQRSLFWTFLLAFAGGFAALLTPCVFPMIPLTVSFFTKQSPTRAKGIRNAISYSLSIVLIYTALGYIVTLFLGPGAMNAISTNPYMNIFFFVIIMFFAISFLGGFDLNLPESWIDRSDKMADKGGLLGIFFMAFVLTLVSFSCTAPIIGPLLVQTASQGGIAPIVGMAGFSLALALPFGFFAGFPAWLNSLPQSGGWMNTVKVTLGFLELALAFKFLSNADLVMQAGLLKRELFLAIWIGIFGVMGLYLLGLFRTQNDGEVPKLSVPRLLFATASIVFTLYLIPGLFGAPLKIISGFPPPKFYSEWKTSKSLGQEGGAESSKTGTKSSSDHGDCPLGLNCFHDYDKALSHAKKVDKPLMVDFTGWACVNCRKMEENVWSEPEVISKLRNKVVLASLYVDERSELPESEQKTVTLNGEERGLETVGNKWSYFQAKHFGVNTQPYYVLLDHQEKELNDPTGYEPSVQAFANWMEAGIENFEKNGKGS